MFRRFHSHGKCKALDACLVVWSEWSLLHGSTCWQTTISDAVFGATITLSPFTVNDSYPRQSTAAGGTQHKDERCDDGSCSHGNVLSSIFSAYTPIRFRSSGDTSTPSMYFRNDVRVQILFDVLTRHLPEIVNVVEIIVKPRDGPPVAPCARIRGALAEYCSLIARMVLAFPIGRR